MKSQHRKSRKEPGCRPSLCA